MSDRLGTGPGLIRSLLSELGEAPHREGLADTPERAWIAWRFMTSGYAADPAGVLKTFTDGAEGVDEMVTQLNSPFWSTCEHHLLPFWGFVHIGYIPSGKVIGLSKLPRLIEVFARRLTMQERLTNQVADALESGLAPLGVGVVVQARHACIEARGVQKTGSVTTTSAMRGVFRTKPEARAEFMSLVNQTVQGRII